MSFLAYPTAMTSRIGRVSGWSVWEVDGRWHWSAFGPRGETQGTAATQADATRRAQAEAENLWR